MTTTSSSVSVSSPPSSEPANSVRRSVSPVGDEPAMRDWAAELVERARSEGVELTGDDGLLTALVRQVLQTGLEVDQRAAPTRRGARGALRTTRPQGQEPMVGVVSAPPWRMVMNRQSRSLGRITNER